MNAQTILIGHIAPVAAALMLLWVAYRLLFVNSNRVQFNRFFLVGAMLFALALPLIGLWMGESAPHVVELKRNLFGGALLGEVTVTPDGAATPQELDLNASGSVATSGYARLAMAWRIIGILYLIGVAVMTVLFLVKLGRLVALIVRSPKEKREGYTVVFTGRDQGSFSFFRYAFFPDRSVNPDIVRHELSHIRHGHSWDVLFAELMMILQWFNPFVYLYKKELQSLHEYQADRDVVATGVDKRNYMMLILQQCTAVDFSGMSNNFSLILTKKRIKMITKNESAKSLWWRLMATLPVVAVLLVANTKVTAQENSTYGTTPQMAEPANSYMVTFPDNASGELFPNDTVFYHPDGSYTEVKHEANVDPVTNETHTSVTLVPYNKDGSQKAKAFTAEMVEHNGKQEVRIVPNESIFLAIAPEKDTDSIYATVDEMPEFPGGVQALMEYLASNIKYPEKAMDDGVEGRVFISFVVEKDGTVDNLTVMKSLSEECDNEAVRVIKAMPKWKPGIQDGLPVRVSYIIPINFKLTGDEKK